MEAVKATNYASTLYFVSLVLFGNYILFSLLVAILLDGFAAAEKRGQTNACSDDMLDIGWQCVEALETRHGGPQYGGPSLRETSMCPQDFCQDARARVRTDGGSLSDIAVRRRTAQRL